MSDNFLIKTENLRMEYLGGKVVALDNVSETIKKGEVVVIIGPSGSGSLHSSVPSTDLKNPRADTLFLTVLTL